MAAYLRAAAEDPRGPRFEEVCEGMRLASIIAAATCESFGTAALMQLCRDELQTRRARWQA